MILTILPSHGFTLCTKGNIYAPSLTCLMSAWSQIALKGYPCHGLMNQVIDVPSSSLGRDPNHQMPWTHIQTSLHRFFRTAARLRMMCILYLRTLQPHTSANQQHIRSKRHGPGFFPSIKYLHIEMTPPQLQLRITCISNVIDDINAGCKRLSDRRSVG